MLDVKGSGILLCCLATVAFGFVTERGVGNQLHLGAIDPWVMENVETLENEYVQAHGKGKGNPDAKSLNINVVLVYNSDWKNASGSDTRASKDAEEALESAQKAMELPGLEYNITLNLIGTA